MSNASLREGLRHRVQHLNTLITKAERKIELSDLRTHVKLAGELKALRTRRTQLEARLASLNDRPAGTWSELKAALDYETDEIALAVQNWITKF